MISKLGYSLETFIGIKYISLSFEYKSQTDGDDIFYDTTEYGLSLIVHSKNIEVIPDSSPQGHSYCCHWFQAYEQYHE